MTTPAPIALRMRRRRGKPCLPPPPVPHGASQSAKDGGLAERRKRLSGAFLTGRRGGPALTEDQGRPRNVVRHVRQQFSRYGLNDYVGVVCDRGADRFGTEAEKDHTQRGEALASLSPSFARKIVDAGGASSNNGVLAILFFP